MNPWNPTEDTRIYRSRSSGEFDPLHLRQELVLLSDGDVWRVQNRRHAAAKALNELPDHDEIGRAQAEVDLATAERQLAAWARRAFVMPDEVSAPNDPPATEAEALLEFDHFLAWLNQVKSDTRD